MSAPSMSNHRVLALFAHPDDEAFSSAGTLASLISLGASVTVVSATSGELGEIRIDDLIDRDNLGDVRQEELREAMRQIRVSDVRFLGFRDSGMEGTEGNRDPRSLAASTRKERTRAFTRLLDDVRPTSIITFNRDGIYLHPDHIAVHRMVVDGLEDLAESEPELLPDHLYFASVPRSEFEQFLAMPDNPFSYETPERLAMMGTPDEEIAYIVDISAFGEQKIRTMAAHRTQFGDQGPMESFDPSVRERFLNREAFAHIAIGNNPKIAGPDPISFLPKADRSPA